ncbi:Histone transcription regulator 3 [Borealophlyctis nickersoniae]|nr:Histone transcription regulator 3 [Borealophlyctis nickersoniae]
MYSHILPHAQAEGAHSTPGHSLHYVVHKGYAAILEKEERWEEALGHYQKAFYVDSTDVFLSCKLGDLLMRLKDFDAACEAYEGGLRRADTSMLRFTCLDGLCNALYEVGDFPRCLKYLRDIVTENPSYPRGIFIKQKIIEELLAGQSLTSVLLEDIGSKDILEFRASQQTLSQMKLDPKITKLREPRPSGLFDVEHNPIIIELKDWTWLSFGLLLLQAYEKAFEDDETGRGQAKSATCDIRTLRLEIRSPDARDGATPMQLDVAETDEAAGESGEGASEQPSAEVAADVEMNGAIMTDTEKEGPVPEKKRKRPVEDTRREAPRSSKRVRDKMEQEQQRKVVPDIDLADALDKWLPVGYSLASEKRESSASHRMVDIVPDVSVYLSVFSAKLLSPGPTKTRKRQITKKSTSACKNPSLASASAPSADHDPQFSPASLKAFINDIGAMNSGILDVMRQCVLYMIVGHITADGTFHRRALQCKWPEGLRELVVSMILKLERHAAGVIHLLNALPEVSTAEIVGAHAQREYLLEILLGQAEVVFDALPLRMRDPNGDSQGDISDDQDDGEDENPLVSTSKWHVFERLWLHLVDFLNLDRVDLTPTIRARFQWLHARFQERLNNIDRAAELFRELKESLASDHESIHLINYHCDQEISAESVQHRLRMLQSRQYILSADDKAAEGDHDAVVECLGPVFFGPEKQKISSPEDAVDSSHQMAHDFVYHEIGLDRRFRLGELTIEALESKGAVNDAWVCQIIMLIDAIKCVPTEAELVDVVSMISLLLGRIIARVEKGDNWQLPLEQPVPKTLLFANADGTLFAHFISSLFLCVRMSRAYMARHKELSTKRGRSQDLVEVLPTFVIQAWVAFYHVLKKLFELQDAEGVARKHSSTLKESTSGAREVSDNVGPSTDGGDASTPLDGEDELLRMDLPDDVNGESNDIEKPDLIHRGDSVDELGEILAFVHEELGQAGMCAEENGCFLRIALRHFIALGDEYQGEIFQCYYCLYGANIKLSPDVVLTDHHSESLPFERDAATEVFETVAAYVSRKIESRQYRAITNDVRDCLDKVAEVFGEPPWENVRVAVNRELINRYLQSELELEEVVPSRPSKLQNVLEFSQEDRQKLSDVYFRLYNIQGTIAWAQAKARHNQISRNRKSVELFQIAAEQFLYHLYLNPKSFDAWLSLANCYASISYDLLLWNSTIIRTGKMEIREYQMKAFQCFVQATKTAPKGPAVDRKDLAMRLWGEFGYLCHAIVTKPMEGIAVKSHLSRAQDEWSKRYQSTAHPDDFVTKDQDDATIVEEAKRYILQVGAYCFRQGRRWDPSEWQYPFMLGCIYAKLGKDQKDILPLYKKAVKLVPEVWHTKEQEKILQPILKLVSYLCKLLWKNNIDEVIDILDDVSPNSPPSSAPSSAAPSAPGSPSRATQSAIETHINADLDDRMRAFDRLAKELRRARQIDKKRWQHKPSSKLAWLYYYVHKQPEKAKNELMVNFSLKPMSKSVAYFWKPEFERPGKHFVYLHKYTLFMLQLLKETNDAETLRQMCRRLRKGDDVLLEPKAVWTVAYDSLLEVLSATADGEGCTRLSGTMSKAEFDSRAAEVEARIFEAAGTGTDSICSERLKTLHQAFELKKLNEGAEDEEALNLLLADTYSSLFLDFGGPCGHNTSAEKSPKLNGIGGGSEKPGEGPAADSAGSGTAIEQSPLHPDTEPPELVRFSHVLARVLQVCKNPPNRRPTTPLQPSSAPVKPEDDSELPVPEVDAPVPDTAAEVSKDVDLDAPVENGGSRDMAADAVEGADKVGDVEEETAAGPDDATNDFDEQVDDGDKDMAEDVAEDGRVGDAEDETALGPDPAANDLDEPMENDGGCADMAEDVAERAEVGDVEDVAERAKVGDVEDVAERAKVGNVADETAVGPNTATNDLDEQMQSGGAEHMAEDVAEGAEVGGVEDEAAVGPANDLDEQMEIGEAEDMADDVPEENNGPGRVEFERATGPNPAANPFSGITFSDISDDDMDLE